MDCAVGACVLIWILELMEKEVTGTRMWDGGPEW